MLFLSFLMLLLLPFLALFARIYFVPLALTACATKSTFNIFLIPLKLHDDVPTAAADALLW